MLNRIVLGLSVVFAADRLLKLAAVIHFFRRPSPPAPQPWPSVTLLQPITRGVSALAGNLAARARLHYGASVQHVLVCDRDDSASQAVCAEFRNNHPDLAMEIVLAAPDSGSIASKTAKLQAGMPHVHGDIVCAIDDDVAPRPDTLDILVQYLCQPGVGAVFGLACYTNWRTPWASLMSTFVNANALLSYIPLCYLTEPYTITGHCFAVQRATLDAVGGFGNMDQRIDDDHELARRLRQHGLCVVQTPLIYDIDNDLTSWATYAAQMKRWFVFPRQAMLPWLSRREQAVTALGSVGNVVPGMLLLLTTITRRRVTFVSLVTSIGIFSVVYVWGERYLGRRTPLHRSPLVLAGALTTPFHALVALVGNAEITWRGQRLRIARGGRFEVL